VPWSSAVAFWLLDLTALTLCKDSGMVGFLGRLWDSGAGRGTVAAAIVEGFPIRVLTAAVYEGISCWAQADFADRVFSALCREFGGREEKSERS
jgi:6-phosphogluconate dehydrogenase